MVTARLASRLPSGDADGLAPIVQDLVEHPGEIRVLVVLADVVKVTLEVEAGARLPTLRIRRLEAITDPQDRKALRRLLMREFERRTHAPVLPLDLENDVRAAFGELEDDPP